MYLNSRILEALGMASEVQPSPEKLLETAGQGWACPQSLQLLGTSSWFYLPVTACGVAGICDAVPLHLRGSGPFASDTVGRAPEVLRRRGQPETKRPGCKGHLGRDRPLF